MASIRDWLTGAYLTVDQTAKAARVTTYRTDGSVLPECRSRNYYRACSATTFTAAASTSPFFAIQGSASKTIRIIAIRLTGFTLTASAYQTVIAQKRSTAINGGTSIALVQVPNDSSSPAGTASLINVYTAAPTAGTLIGTISTSRFLAADTTPTALMTEDHELSFYKDHEDGVVLTGVAEGLTISFAIAPATAVSMCIEICWSEE